MRLENIGFKDALFKCAEISGVDINFQEKIKPQPKRYRSSLTGCFKLLSKFIRKQIWITRH